MAKTSSLRGQRMTQKGPKRTKTAAPQARKAARKAPAKAPKAAAPKARKAAARKPARAPKATVAEESAMPRKAVSPLARRRARAPPRQARAASKAEAVAEHLHQDPRMAGTGGVNAEPSKVQTFNYGQFKNKAVARFDKPVNWFRRAPRPKQ